LAAAVSHLDQFSAFHGAAREDAAAVHLIAVRHPADFESAGLLA
jgi:rhodanese-related sulfurtransferase